MERSRLRIGIKVLLLGVGLFSFSWGVTGLAGVVLMSSSPQTDPQNPKKSYPESRFGAPPAPVQVGVGPHFASHAVEDIGDEDLNSSSSSGSSSSGGRSPASLQFTEQTTPMSAQSIIPQDKGLNSAANVNPTPNTLSRTGIQEVALIAGDLGFFPKTIFVSRNIPVKLFITGASKKSLCFMIDFFQIRRQIRAEKIEEISFTPSTPGQYRFYCPINGMEGTLLVKEGGN